jgi:hypothetical protein
MPPADRATEDLVARVEHRAAQLVGAVDPVQSASRGFDERAVSRRLGELEQAHRRHRVLVDGVDLVALDDAARPGVVEPGPAAIRQLELEQALAGAAGGRKRAAVVVEPQARDG